MTDNLPRNTGPTALNPINHAISRTHRALVLFTEEHTPAHAHEAMTGIDAAIELLRTLKHALKLEIRDIQAVQDQWTGNRHQQIDPDEA